MADKPTFSAMMLVEIDVKGILEREAPEDAIGYPSYNKDITIKFHKWLRENKIYSYHNGRSGLGHDVSFFFKKDAEKIIAWLKEQGVVQVQKVFGG